MCPIRERSASVIPHPSCGGCRKEGGCGTRSRWVLAACEGMIAVFAEHHGELEVISQGGGAVASSLAGFQSFLEAASDEGRFGHLLAVGTEGDIRWLLLSLPESLQNRIIAQIHYPLFVSWFREGDKLESLGHALSHLMQKK